MTYVRFIPALVIVLGAFCPAISLYAGAQHPADRSPHARPHIRTAPESIVPPRERMSDTRAKFLMAQAMLHVDSRQRIQQASEILHGLYWKGYAQRQVAPLFLQAMLRLDRRDEVLATARKMTRLWAADPLMLANIADIYARLGRYRSCRDLYRQAMQLPSPESGTGLCLRFAEHMFLWGDYYGALSVYAKWLHKHPGDRKVQIKRGDALVAAQRFIQAAAQFRRLLDGHHQDRYTILLKLAGLEMNRKDFDQALHYLQDLPPENGKGMLLKGRALLAAGHIKEAESAFLLAAADEDLQAQALLGLGKVSLRQNRTQEADKKFAAARAVQPEDATIRFLAAGPDTAGSPAFVHDLTRSTRDPKQLVDWAEVYARQGLFRAARTCYRAILDREKEYYPASLGLAQTLAADGNPEAALQILKDLRIRFPESFKVAITQARILGWSGKYSQSLAAYHRMMGEHPEDTVARREAARTAYWAKRNERGDRLYLDMCVPAVDTSLQRALLRAAEANNLPEIDLLADAISTPHTGDPTFQGFEALRQKSGTLLPPVREPVQRIIDRLRPVYALQKRAWLEYRSKHLTWNKRFIPAMDSLQELVRIEPGNEEAQFDLAQTQCVLGLHDLQAETYARLLDRDPLHSLARRAQKMSRIRAEPSLGMKYSLWEENGRGELARIARRQTGLNLKIPFLGRHSIDVFALRFWEHPTRNGHTATANGAGMTVNVRYNEFLAAEAGLQSKDYLTSKYASLKTGHLGVRINAWDAAHIHLRGERTNIVPNVFALRQGVQADTWRAQIGSDLSHALFARLGGEYTDYNDHNSQMRTDGAIRYSLTEYPRELTVTLSGEYRDTRESSQEYGSPVKDIVHPYWTPQDYLGTALTLGWRHDMSTFRFCGSRKNVYDLQMSMGTNTDANPSLELRGAWRLDFSDHWSLNIQGMVHNSGEWDAHSLLVGIRCRL